MNKDIDPIQKVNIWQKLIYYAVILLSSWNVMKSYLWGRGEEWGRERKNPSSGLSCTRIVGRLGDGKGTSCSRCPITLEERKIQLAIIPTTLRKVAIYLDIPLKRQRLWRSISHLVDKEKKFFKGIKEGPMGEETEAFESVNSSTILIIWLFSPQQFPLLFW